MPRLIDTIYTFRFLKILSSKWTDMDAYEYGIVDENGVALRHSSELTTDEEKASYTPFHRLIFKLKRLMEKIPGGKSFVGRYGAALLLIKEHKEEVEAMGVDFSVLTEGLKKYMSIPLNEEDGGDGGDGDGGPTNKTGGIARKDMPLGDGMARRKKKESCAICSKNVTDKNVGKTNEEVEEPKYSYQVIGDALIRVDEVRHVIKRRVVGGVRQKKREVASGKGSRYTRTGNRKLRGGALTKKRHALKKALRKAHTGAAQAKRKRSLKKGKMFR